MKRIPIGISDFKTLIDEDYLFVDKSLLIKEFWESDGQTILIPRPRRFGKTLNMSMIKYFFENNGDDNREIFKDLNIESHKDIMQLQGKYPVIYLSFKDEKHSSFEYLREGLSSVFSKLFIDHEYCLNNSKIHSVDKEYYNSVINKKTTIIELSNALKKLSENDSHEVLSNRESGYGRYDVMIIPKDISKLGIVIEFKKLDPDDEETLEETADEALKQIEEKKYATTLEDRGIKNIKEIGIVFKGKELFIKERKNI